MKISSKILFLKNNSFIFDFHMKEFLRQLLNEESLSSSFFPMQQIHKKLIKIDVSKKKKKLFWQQLCVFPSQIFS
jgi:hypothetical protein